MVIMSIVFIDWGSSFVPGSLPRRLESCSRRCLRKDAVCEPSHRGGKGILAMGAAGKKKKKVNGTYAKHKIPGKFRLHTRDFWMLLSVPRT